MLNLVRRLTTLRRQHPVLGNTAAFRPLFAKRGRYPFVYERRLGRHRAVVVVNPAGRRETARFALPGAARARELIASRCTLTPTRSGAEVTVGSRGWGIFIL